ncbi:MULTISPECIES: hypothetical protein [Bacillus cereus group]|uniref:hypothetical protein n=1 Tax=Bacillus cereus group TaxID=86661 RepID=UPI0008640478|nr:MULTISPECIES: hypothetical protein [Bacillus cereus group]SCM85995.1 Protein of unknown function [Bacillus mycoides]
MKIQAAVLKCSPHMSGVDGADAINLFGEHTALNKEELNKLREKMNAYYPKMIFGLVS